MRDRLDAMELTGNPKAEDLDRCAHLLYADGGTSTSCLYDCIRNDK